MATINKIPKTHTDLEGYPMGPVYIRGLEYPLCDIKQCLIQDGKTSYAASIDEVIKLLKHLADHTEE